MLGMSNKATDSGLVPFCFLSRWYLPSTLKTTEQLFYYAYLKLERSFHSARILVAAV